MRSWVDLPENKQKNENFVPDISNLYQVPQEWSKVQCFHLLKTNQYYDMKIMTTLVR
jgi:hypothetical protein